jgi:methylmalonyl-CoA epimerase
MKVPTIDHIGIIVENLERSVAMFERMFDLKSSGIEEMPDVGLRIAELKGANISIELLQYSDEGESLAKKTMGVKPGINHLSIRVEDIKSSLEDLESKGLRVIEGFPRRGSHGQVAFFTPETTQDILLEICEG